jgi:hypothetical protein
LDQAIERYDQRQKSPLKHYGAIVFQKSAESEKVGARPAGQTCKAYSLVSRCKRASFGTRSPLPVPLSTHTYRVRVIRAKKFGFVPQKHSQIISAQKANPTGPIYVHTEIRLRQASTFSPTYPPFSSSLSISCPCSTSKPKHGQPVGSG